jgi:hypothetical protein
VAPDGLLVILSPGGLMSYSWLENKQRLWALIKRVSDKYGGDDQEFIEEYFKELVIKYKNELTIPIATFEDLLK